MYDKAINTEIAFSTYCLQIFQKFTLICCKTNQKDFFLLYKSECNLFALGLGRYFWIHFKYWNQNKSRRLWQTKRNLFLFLSYRSKQLVFDGKCANNHRRNVFALDNLYHSLSNFHPTNGFTSIVVTFPQ